MTDLTFTIDSESYTQIFQSPWHTFLNYNGKESFITAPTDQRTL